MLPLEDLGSGETPKEQVDSRVDEPKSGVDLESEIPQPNTDGHGSSKLNPMLPPPFQYRYSPCQKGFMAGGRCCEVKVFQPFRAISSTIAK